MFNFWPFRRKTKTLAPVQQERSTVRRSPGVQRPYPFEANTPAPKVYANTAYRSRESQYDGAGLVDAFDYSIAGSGYSSDYSSSSSDCGSSSGGGDSGGSCGGGD